MNAFPIASRFEREQLAMERADIAAAAIRNATANVEYECIRRWQERQNDIAGAVDSDLDRRWMHPFTRDLMRRYDLTWSEASALFREYEARICPVEGSEAARAWLNSRLAWCERAIPLQF